MDALIPVFVAAYLSLGVLVVIVRKLQEIKRNCNTKLPSKFWALVQMLIWPILVARGIARWKR